MFNVRDISCLVRGRMRLAALACLLACTCAFACGAVGASAAFAQSLPDGSGKIDLSMVTQVNPALDPDAQLVEVGVRAVDESGAPVCGAALTVAIKPPNAEALEASSGVSDASGCARFGGAVVGARHVVGAFKEGYTEASLEVVCQGSADEVWEVVLKRHKVPPVPPNPDDPDNPDNPDDPDANGGGSGGSDGSGSNGAGGSDGQEIRPLPVAGGIGAASVGAAGAAGVGGQVQPGDGSSAADSARGADGFQSLAYSAPFQFPWVTVALGAVVFLFVLLAAFLLGTAWKNRSRKKGETHGRR